MACTKQHRTYLPYTFPAVAGTHLPTHRGASFHSLPDLSKQCCFTMHIRFYVIIVATENCIASIFFISLLQSDWCEYICDCRVVGQSQDIQDTQDISSTACRITSPTKPNYSIHTWVNHYHHKVSIFSTLICCLMFCLYSLQVGLYTILLLYFQTVYCYNVWFSCSNF